jgi:hypothetical protein
MLLLAVTLAAVAFPVRGGPISIFNTGVVSMDPVALAADGAVDQHYSLISSADSRAIGTNAYVAGPNLTYPLGPWLLNGPDSKWISPFLNPATNGAVGGYTYRTTFDLTGLDPATVILTGRWATDNSGSITLNGSATGNTTGVEQFGGWTSFTISSGFIAGINTLDFVVTNVPGIGGASPTGLRVEISGTADGTIPEPSMSLPLAMITFGAAAGIKLRMRRRRLIASPGRS